MNDEYIMVERSLNGTTRYYKNKRLHREDGPAIEWYDGDNEWWVDGKLHREDGPAIEYYNGTKSWFVRGKRHREDGPAIEWIDNLKDWYVNDNNITDEVEEWISSNNIPYYEEWTNKEIAQFKLKFL